ncbi:hypothetical protein EPR50_G00104580 [Perca flavescens]|uniref:HAT C-terminal dimerisation domain-containing protein n=1 Tax=Perca flavescens TaxID=8167 RepID=A0A484CWT5_PERFV|nr:hypothetical protein EPR50_G00104580 [Perca flavescens]
MARKVEDLLSGLYTLYHKSGVNRVSLKQHFRELHMKALMPTRVGGTRWLPHLFKALDHFLRGYAGIVRHLEEKSQEATNINFVLRAKAKGLLKIGKDGGVLRFCCLLHDTIFQLSNLSKSLQRSVSTLAEAQSCLSSTQAVIEMYKSRFSDVNSGVLQAMRLTSFQCWPEADTSSGTFENTWPTVNTMLRHRCPDVLDLFDALLTIPATTADCERGFSVMKQVKSDWRSRLKGETLSDLLKTQLCSPDIKDFDPTKAIDIWHADSVRKHGTKGTEGGSDSDGTTSEEEEL